MNEAELARNKQLTEFAVKDLNEDPTLPYADASFDVITNAGARPRRRHTCTPPPAARTVLPVAQLAARRARHCARPQSAWTTSPARWRCSARCTAA